MEIHPAKVRSVCHHRVNSSLRVSDNPVFLLRSETAWSCLISLKRVNRQKAKRIAPISSKKQMDQTATNKDTTRRLQASDKWRTVTAVASQAARPIASTTTIRTGLISSSDSGRCKVTLTTTRVTRLRRQTNTSNSNSSTLWTPQGRNLDSRPMRKMRS